MSKHVWLQRTIGEGTLDYGWKAFVHAKSKGASDKLAMQFAGYVLESERQKGGPYSIEYRWRGVVGSNHRFSRGRNKDNYLDLGKRILASRASLVGLAPDAPYYGILDKMKEEGLLD